LDVCQLEHEHEDNNRKNNTKSRDRQGRYCMIFGFTATYAISAYHHKNCRGSIRVHGKVYSI